MKLSPFLVAIALVAVAIGGCGSSDSSSSSESSTADRTESTIRKHSSDGEGGSKPAGGGEGSATAPTGGGVSKSQPSIAEEEAQAGDQSIQEYGVEAEGDEKEAAIAAMRKFFKALGSRDYAAVCAGVSAANREELAQLERLNPSASKGCPDTVQGLLSPAAAPAARKASTDAVVGKVRVKDGTAFILFRVPGDKLSYIVMKEEDGAWKSTTLAAGALLSP